MNLKKIKRAIISVSDKSNLKIILKVLKKYNIEIISTGGSFKKIKSLKYNCIEVANYTGFSEILDGRVKTLHPKIYAGILNIRKNKRHRKDLKKRNIPEIDLVIVDVYPFEKKLIEKIRFEKLIEYIDIGGPTLIRSAAKNFQDVTVITNINDYFGLKNELKKNNGSTSLKFRKFMSSKAFGLTSYYDAIISNWLNNHMNIKFPEKYAIPGKLIKKLLYGENPHQEAGLYASTSNLNLNQLNGKVLSYNNYNDIYYALSTINSFKKKEGTVIIKHANICGASLHKNQLKSYKNSLDCDPISAFGGLVAVNSVIKKNLAIELNKTFFEIILARGFDKNALKILKKRKKIILIDCKKFNPTNDKHYFNLGNSFLSQDSDNILIGKKLKIVSKKKPSIKQLVNLKFAFNMCKFSKSNAIVLVNDQTTIGIGSGQPSRLDSCKIAANKALEFCPEKIMNSAAASDAFFPFTDGIQELIDAGVSAIIQPGGSINDAKIIKAANKAKIVMAFTGTRHFKH